MKLLTLVLYVCASLAPIVFVQGKEPSAQSLSAVEKRLNKKAWSDKVTDREDAATDLYQYGPMLPPNLRLTILKHLLKDSRATVKQQALAVANQDTIATCLLPLIRSMKHDEDAEVRRLASWVENSVLQTMKASKQKEEAKELKEVK